MALTLIPEDGTGLSTANSFASVAEADAYHEGHLYASTWTGAATGTKEAALVMATRLIDRRTNWVGDKLTGDQALAWPRENAEVDGHEVASNVVPQPVKDATAELARLLIAEDLTKDVDQNQLEAIGLGKGALKIEFNGKTKNQIPGIVDDLLGGFGDFQSSTGFRTAKLSR